MEAAIFTPVSYMDTYPWVGTCPEYYGNPLIFSPGIDAWWCIVLHVGQWGDGSFHSIGLGDSFLLITLTFTTSLEWYNLTLYFSDLSYSLWASTSIVASIIITLHHQNFYSVWASCVRYAAQIIAPHFFTLPVSRMTGSVSSNQTF